MLKFNPFWIIITLMSSLFISACSNQEYIICDYPMRVPEEIQTVISDDEKIVLNFPSVSNNDFYDEEEYYTYAFAYAHAVAESHCSEFGKTSKLENESTNESLHLLEFKCED